MFGGEYVSLTTEFWVQIVICAISFGITFGSIRTRLNHMEKKLDKHNNFAERVIALEQSCKSAHHRIGELREDVEELERS